MIYTIGHVENYLKAIANSPTGKIKKVGRCEPNDRFPNGYEGGYAFASREDAQKRIDEAHADKGFDVFGLDADWEKDTSSVVEGWWHALINSADVIVLEEVRLEV